MDIKFRKSQRSDIDKLIKLEETCFEAFQKSSRKSIYRSIVSPFQEVIILELKPGRKDIIGALVLFKYKKALRIYSIAISPEHQGKGIGKKTLEYAIDYAHLNYYERIVLEAHHKNKQLIDWYQINGFVRLQTISNYYGKGEHAVKMVYELKGNGSGSGSGANTNNVIVINQPYKWTLTNINARVVSVKEYLNNPAFQSNDLKVFNLCSSYKYQSYGYYVSLLAMARGQRIVPNTATIRDFNLLNIIRSTAFDVEDSIHKSLLKIQSNSFRLNIYFGRTEQKGLEKLAMQLYQLFEVPLFEVHFIKHDTWIIKDMKVLTLSKMPENEMMRIQEYASAYFNKKRFNKTKLRKYKYDIAILVNPAEKTPPSCQKALQKFKQAGNRKGLYVEFITKADFNKLNEFDALFIRETTRVNDHTYEFSRMAYSEGLVVIDDPWSILKCSNKIFQNELFRKNKILTPQTRVFTKNLFDKKMLSQLDYPVVLKQPDSAFSLGVTKVENQEEALIELTALFKISDMVICQEFMYSEFDWRIGVLDNAPLFACKYYMTTGHWQIYNWTDGASIYDCYGDSETLNIEDVPDAVIKTAIKASALIGDGLYGVDLKMVNDKVYVVELNDNPNIDVDEEDFILKDKLYDMVIDSIYNRIEISKNIQKIDFNHTKKTKHQYR